MKKVIALFLVVAACSTLAACSLLSPTPESIAEEYASLDGYGAILLVNSDDVESWGVEIYNASPRHISYVLIAYEENGDHGVYLFCKDKKAADRVEEDLEDSFYQIERDFDDAIIERDGSVIFFGEEDTWQEIH